MTGEPPPRRAPAGLSSHGPVSESASAPPGGVYGPGVVIIPYDLAGDVDPGSASWSHNSGRWGPEELEGVFCKPSDATKVSALTSEPFPFCGS